MKFFWFIIVLSIVLRFWQLGVVPVSPDWDEAALGYNAYSILKTGRDEYGTFLPRSLRSFDDYKPPLYVYLTVPSVAAFGLNLWATRLPSAVMGVLAVIGTYFFVVELFKSKKLALCASFLLAISPWHLQFSRIAFEANSGVTLNIWGLYFLLRARKNPHFLIFSAIVFGLALYAYHSERLFAPLIALCVFLLWFVEYKKYKKFIGIAVVCGILVVAPLLPVLFDKTSIVRLKGTSSLSDQTGLLMRSVGHLEDDKEVGKWSGSIFDNRRIVYAKTLIDGYLSHFSLKWLFLTGDNDRHHAPDNGLLYLWELPFLLYGFFLVFSQRSKEHLLLIIWLLLAPLAASPTSETPHAIRTLVFLPALQLVTALGLLHFLKIRKHNIVQFCLFGLIACNIFFYFHMYYRHMNNESSRFWQYGYKQTVEYTEKVKEKYKKIVVSTKLEQPHMFYLFYTKYDPALYLAQGGTASGGFAEIRNAFDKYEFREIAWEKEVHDGTILYVGTPKDIGVNPLVSLNYLDGFEAIRISE